MTASEREGWTSTTAVGTLAMACLAAAERDVSVRVVDDLSPRLLNWRDGQPALARIGALRPLLHAISSRRVPGAYGYVLARLRHLDAIVEREVAAGLDRLVILGAGYDTRAYRLRDRLADVRVIEVDHPTTSREKRARLSSALGAPLHTVTYLEVDLTSETLLERLSQSGHDLSLRTLFLLSGVAMFLPRAAVVKLIEHVGAHASTRTSLAFDYVDAGVLDTPEAYFGGRKWVNFTTDAGEPPRSGFARGELESVLSSQGLTLDSHRTADELTVQYLRRPDGTTVARPYGFAAIAHARVVDV